MGVILIKARMDKGVSYCFCGSETKKVSDAAKIANV